MSIAATLLQTNRALETHHPEMSNADRAALASRLVSEGHAWFHSATGGVVFSDDARALAPKLPVSTSVSLVRRAREAAEAEGVTGARHAGIADDGVRDPDPEVQAALSAVPKGRNERGARALARERVAAKRLGDKFNPTKESP